MRFLVVALLAALVALLMLTGIAEARAKELTFDELSGDWTVISGEANAQVGVIVARGIKDGRIRYNLRYSADESYGFSVDKKSGVISYDGTPLRRNVSVRFRAYDRKGNAISAYVQVNFQIRQPEPKPEPQQQQSQPQAQQQQPQQQGQQQQEPERHHEKLSNDAKLYVDGVATDIPVWSDGPLNSATPPALITPANAEHHSENHGGFRYVWVDHDGDRGSSTPRMLFLRYNVVGKRTNSINAVWWLAKDYLTPQHKLHSNGMPIWEETGKYKLGEWRRTTSVADQKIKRDGLKPMAKTRIEWFSCKPASPVNCADGQSPTDYVYTLGMRMDVRSLADTLLGDCWWGATCPPPDTSQQQQGQQQQRGRQQGLEQQRGLGQQGQQQQARYIGRLSNDATLDGTTNIRVWSDATTNLGDEFETRQIGDFRYVWTDHDNKMNTPRILFFRYDTTAAGNANTIDTVFWLAKDYLTPQHKLQKYTGMPIWEETGYYKFREWRDDSTKTAEHTSRRTALRTMADVEVQWFSCKEVKDQDDYIYGKSLNRTVRELVAELSGSEQPNWLFDN